MDKKIKSLSQNLVSTLVSKSLTIATAESLTGGLVSAAITSVPGASMIFGLGLCTYWEQMKEDFFHLEREIQNAKTAVAREVAIGMADGVRKLAGSTFGLATTGLAGPTDDGINPVGTVYISVAWETGCRVSKLELGNIGREKICNETVIRVLEMTIEEVKRLKN